MLSSKVIGFILALCLTLNVFHNFSENRRILETCETLDFAPELPGSDKLIATIMASLFVGHHIELTCVVAINGPSAQTLQMLRSNHIAIPPPSKTRTLFA